MKDYACERLYRDARILSIYEGTSQMQVVAAIRFVTNGAYLAKLRQYEMQSINPEFVSLRNRLIEMTNTFEKTVADVIALKNSEYIDFQARRMVEMAGHIVMGYLLVIDASRNDMFRKSAEIYVNYGEAEVKRHASFIAQFEVNNLDVYRQ